MGELLKVSIIEDDKHYREGLTDLINKSGNYIVLASYPDAEQALSHISKHIPDIALVDIKLPGLNGVDLIYKIKSIAPDIKCLVCSFYDDNEYIFNALKNGASGYILKDSLPEEILNSLDELQKGGAPMSRYIAKKVIEVFQGGVNNPPTLNELSEKENKILHMFSEGKLPKEIIDSLEISQNTLSKHMQNIYSKLHVNNRMDALKKIKNKGEVVYSLKTEENQQQFKITTESLLYFFKIYNSQNLFISHDLRRTKYYLHNSLSKILNILQTDNTIASKSEIKELLNFAINESELINPIISVLNYNPLTSNINEKKNIESFLYCNLYDIISELKQHEKSLEIDVSKANMNFNFLYPSTIMYSFFSEFAKNALKESPINNKLYIKWQILDRKLQCEFHDNGNGFTGLQIRQFVTYNDLQPLLSEKAGIGLKLISKTISDSNGNIFFSNSDLLNGALIYFEIPLIDFKYKLKN